MLVLSFRDMSVNACGAVTPAAVYDIDPITPDFSWNPPPGRQLALEPWDALGHMLYGKHVCFVIHGFNVNRDNGYTGLGAFAQEFGPNGALQRRNPPLDLLVPGVDLFIPVLWSGDWYLPVNYPFLLPDIRQTAGYFAEFLRSRVAQLGMISFVTHSMGARVALESIQHTIQQFAAAGLSPPRFQTAVLMAAAASDEVLDDPGYKEAVASVKKFVIVTSMADKVLQWDFPMGNLVEKALWANDPGADAALGRFGPKLGRDSPALAKTSWYALQPVNGSGYDHGDYLPRPSGPVPQWPNGWSEKCSKIGAFCQVALIPGQSPPWPPESKIVPEN